MKKLIMALTGALVVLGSTLPGEAQWRHRVDRNRNGRVERWETRRYNRWHNHNQWNNGNNYNRWYNGNRHWRNRYNNGYYNGYTPYYQYDYYPTYYNNRVYRRGWNW